LSSSRVSALVLAFAICVPAPAAAQAAELGATVWLRELPCEPARYDSAALGALLQVELRALRLALEPFPAGDPAAQAEALGDGLALLTVRCGGADDAVELELDDLGARTRSARTLALSDIPIDQRPRALALAIGSSLEQSLSAALLRPEEPADQALPPATMAVLRARLLRRLQSPGDVDVPTPMPAPETQPVPAGPAPGSVELAAMTRAFPSYSTGLLGVQGGAGVELAPSWTLDVDGEALAGQSELSDTRGTVGTMWLYWLSAGLGFSVHAGTGDQPALALGPRLRIGYAFADAQSDRDGASAEDDAGALVAALLTATLRAPISRDASLLFGADLGYTLVGIIFVGDQARLSGMAGVTLGLRAGVSL